MKQTGQRTGPVNFSPGPWPGSSGIDEASRKARRRRDSRRARVVVADDGGGTGDEAGEGRDELARLVEVDEVGGGLLGSVLGEADLDGGADMRWTAVDVMISTAGTSAMSRVTSATASAALGS